MIKVHCCNIAWNETIEPGNMTRYEILYTEWDEPAQAHPTDQERMFSITVFGGSSGIAFKFRKDMAVNHDYITSKTGWKGSDLAAIMGYLHRQGVPIGNMVPGYDAHGNYLSSKETQQC